MASGVTPNYAIPYPLQTDPVDVAGDVEQLATRIDTYINEWIQDVSALMITSGSYTNGINTPIYNDTTGTISISLSQDLQSTASPTFVNLNLTGSILTPSVIDVTSATNALRITQKGSGNALLVEDSTNPDNTPFVINADGQIISGTTTAFNGYSTSLQLVGTDSLVDGGINTRRISDSYIGQSVFIEKARGTIASPQIVDDNDEIGKIVFNAFDGTSWVPAAEISSIVNGVPGTGDMPGAIVFSTTPDNFSLPFERMRITNNGYVGINTINPSAELEVNGQIIADGGLFNSLVSSTSNITNIFATSIDATNIITSSPTSSNDVATKGYVDGLSGSLAQEVIMFDDISSDFDGQTNRFFLTNNQNATKIYNRTNMVVDPSFEGSIANDFTFSYPNTQSPAVISRTNLINNPSFEVDTSGWGASGTAGSISRTSDYAQFGSYCAARSITSDGVAYIQNVPIQVIQGFNYFASAYVRSTVARNARIIINWYTQNDVIVSQTAPSSIATSSSFWTRLSVTGICPANATKAIIFLTIDYAINGDIHYWDSILFEQSNILQPYFDGDNADSISLSRISSQKWNGTSNASTSSIQYSALPQINGGNWVTRTNLVTNPSFEVDTTGWEGSNASTTLARVTTDSVFGSGCLSIQKIATDGNMGAQVATAGIGGVSVTAGVTYCWSTYVKTTVLRNCDVQVEWQTSAGVSISLSAASAVSVQPGEWTRLSLVAIAPATAALARPIVRVLSATVGELGYVDDGLIEQSSTLQAYFDGTSKDSSIPSRIASQAWNGTANNSTSTITYSTLPEGISDRWSSNSSALSNSSTVSRSYAEKYIGNSSLRVSTDGSIINQGAYYFLGSLPANTTYTVSAYVKPESGRPVSMLVYDDINNAFISSSSTSGTTWQRLTVTITTGVLPTVGLIIFRTDATLGASVFYIDAVMCEQTDQLFDYFDGDNAPISAGRIIQKPAWQLNKNNSISTIEYCEPGEFKPTNPNRLQLSINGIIQTVSYPEYVWQSMFPQDGFTVDSDGYVTFSEAPVRGSKFTGRYINGNTTVAETNKRRYPFRPIDLLLGS